MGQHVLCDIASAGKYPATRGSTQPCVLAEESFVLASHLCCCPCASWVSMCNACPVGSGGGKQPEAPGRVGGSLSQLPSHGHLGPVIRRDGDCPERCGVLRSLLCGPSHRQQKSSPECMPRSDSPRPSAWRVTGFSVLRVSRASLESVCRDLKACLGYRASPAPLGRRETSEDREFLESTAPSAPPASRGSEVTSTGTSS